MQISNIRSNWFSPFILSALVTAASSALAGTVVNFNSHKGVPLSGIKSDLQNSCWSFHHFDVNDNGWKPDLEGDGAIVAAIDAPSFLNSGIYSPLLAVSQNISISFRYAFSENFSSASNRWLNICLANENNQVVQILERIEFNGAHAALKNKYSTNFKNISNGHYRLVLQYGGSGGSSRIAIDELEISAPYTYPSGCNTAPVAVKDRITGKSNRTASGSLLLNDKDADRQKLTPYLIRKSSDGTVNLHEDGTFEFVPNEGFMGNTTSFVYRICDGGSANLCSENTTVYISFPLLKVSVVRLMDFNGSYKMNGQVLLAWKTHGTATNENFLVERSLDGKNWQSSGAVSGLSASNDNAYAYIDKVAKNTVQKKDLYYRLKQIHEDGSVATSRLLIVRVYNNKLLTMISVTPNPAKNDISVNVQLQDDGHVSMRLLNETASPVLYKSLTASKGLNSFLMEGSSRIRPGAYSLEVIVNSKERMVIRLIKE